MMKDLHRRRIAGWIAVSFSIAITCLWAFWGILETFHEGWYYESLLSNLGLMFLQYLSPMLIFMGLGLLSISWPRVGGALHAIFALLVAWFFHALTNTVTLLLIAPLIGIGVLYWFGRPRPRKIALSLVAGLPILTLTIAGVEPVLRVSQRFDDGNLQARLVYGNGVDLIWAPDGPGWPRTGASWQNAQDVCAHLDEDGLTPAAEPQDIWRLPTVNEAVRSMARHGQNSGGLWDAETAKATYQTTPDKESPLWNVHSQVIYWWTATEAAEGRAYVIVYDGKVWTWDEEASLGYLGFRCVREP
jgi:hypothetical protein